MSFDKRDYEANGGTFRAAHAVMARKRASWSDDDGFSDQDRKSAMGDGSAAERQAGQKVKVDKYTGTALC